MDSFSNLYYEDSQEVETVTIDLPDSQETQIWESPNDTREVCLYLSTNSGKIAGVEQTPFVLPYRWTFETLRACIEDFVNTRLEERQKVIQIYYKKSGKSKKVVAIHSDRDIPSLLKEYPMITETGNRSKKSTMVMAVDLKPDKPLTRRTPTHNNTHSTPRRSPRLTKHYSTPTATTSSLNMDVFLFDVTKTIKGDPKLSKTATVIHNVPQNCNLGDLKSLVRAHETGSVVYVPANGLFWLRKGTKQLVQLNCEADFENCKQEYSKGKLQSIRIACSSVNMKRMSGADSVADSSLRSKKRCLQFASSNEQTDDDDDDIRDLELAAAVQGASEAKKNTNDLWNDIHCDLIRELEKKGSFSRYNVRHLKLWTDYIVSGRSAGVGDEPKWEEVIDLVGVPPKQRKEKLATSPEVSPTSSSDDLLKALIVQNQQSMNLFQTSLLAIMHSTMRQPQSPLMMPSVMPRMCSTPTASSSPPASDSSNLTDYNSSWPCFPRKES